MSTFVLIAIIILILILLILINTPLSMYKKVPLNKDLIVFGFLGKKVISGGGGTVVLPMLQQTFKISLESRLIILKINEVLTKDGIPVVCNFSFNVKIMNSIVDILKYAEKFLNKSDKEINEILEKILLKYAQEAISLSTSNKLLYNKEKVISILNKISVEELNKIGFIIDNSVWILILFSKLKNLVIIYYEDIVNKIKGDLELELVKK